ncbi:MAG: hypothetical protein ACRECQ_17585 [Burkholderiaceae bacterium]
MYRTSHQTRILSAALAAMFGLGIVATAGGALSEARASSAANLQLVKLEPVIVELKQSSKVAASCADAPKAAL